MLSNIQYAFLGHLHLLLYLRITLSTPVQPLNSTFFPPHVGAEPGRAKEESRITCMRMLRMNQSKITRPQTFNTNNACQTSRAYAFSSAVLLVFYLRPQATPSRKSYRNTIFRGFRKNVSPELAISLS